MIQNQRLYTIYSLLEENKEREVSYFKKITLIWEDKVTDKSFSIVKQKYIWFEKLDWVRIFNSIKWNFLKNTYYSLKTTNFYIPSIVNDSRWWNMINRNVVITKFEIKNSKEFINSLLEFIEQEKETQNIYSEQKQIKDVRDLINKSRKWYDTKFPLMLNIKSYITSHIQYYKILKSFENIYAIENIQIFQWKIIFTLRIIQEININIKFENDILYIDWINVEFQRENTIIFKLIKLVFSYFQKYKTNYVDFDSLEKYYKEHIEDYKELRKAKFNYDYLRKSIETKTKEIEQKHNLKNPFLGINTSWIICQELSKESK